MSTIVDILHAKLTDACVHEIETGEPAGITLTAAETADLLQFIAVQHQRRRKMTLAYRDASREKADYRRKLASIEDTVSDAVTVLGNLRAQLRHPIASHMRSFEGYADVAGRAAHQLAALLGEVRQ